MPITFTCSCGKTLRVADEHAGRRVKCPACNSVANVPAPEPQFEVVEEPEQLAPAPVPAKGRPVAKPAPRDEDDDDDGRGYGVARSDRDDDEKPREKKKPDFRKGSGRADEDEEDEEDERPKKKKWKKQRRRGEQQENGGRSFEGNVINGGVGIGILAMLGAVVWFVIGLANDIIFFYPPILFVIGLVAFFKGLAGGE